MDNRYNRYVINANTIKCAINANGAGGVFVPKEIYIFQKDAFSDLPSISKGEYAEVISVYTDKNGDKAVIPPGWLVSGIEEENTIWGKNVGLVIYSVPIEVAQNIKWNDSNHVAFLQKRFNQFVYVPVNKLSPNATLDEVSFNEKFGRRNYGQDEFSKMGYHEPVVGELANQVESVKKYGGFYISRYNVSNVVGKLCSIKGVKPLRSIDFQTAKSSASSFSDTDLVKSHLVYGAEYDSVLAWFIESKTKTFTEVCEDSTFWGNYIDTQNHINSVANTGLNDKWCVNNIYDIAGNLDEWTQESFRNCYCVIRGGCSSDAGYFFPASYRNYEYPNGSSSNTGFRVSLYIK